MKIVKCDWCGKVFTTGYTMLIRPVSHAKFPEANVAVNQNFPLLMDSYDICSECTQQLVNKRVHEKYSGV